MKNIRQILVAASTAIALTAIPQAFGNDGTVLSSPRQTPDQVIAVPESSPTSSIDLGTTMADTPGSPRMKADPSLTAAPSTYEPQCDTVPEIESMPGSPRQKVDPSDLIQPLPAPIPSNLSMR